MTQAQPITTGMFRFQRENAMQKVGSDVYDWVERMGS